jgi:hypothetical protein
MLLCDTNIVFLRKQNYSNIHFHFCFHTCTLTQPLHFQFTSWSFRYRNGAIIAGAVTGRAVMGDTVINGAVIPHAVTAMNLSHTPIRCEDQHNKICSQVPFWIHHRGAKLAQVKPIT